MSAPGRRIVATVLLAGLCAAFLYQVGLLGMVVWFNFRDPANTPIMQDTLNALRAEDPEARLAHEWVPYEHISANLKRAVIASEDSGFMDHDGIEWDAIRKAWSYNQRQADLGRARRRGGSTITQQLAKNLFLSNSRNYLRKGQELILTYMIEGGHEQAPYSGALSERGPMGDPYLRRPGRRPALFPHGRGAPVDQPGGATGGHAA